MAKTNDNEPTYSANHAAMRDALDLLRAEKAKIVRFELVCRTVRDAKTIVYHVSIERTDALLEDSRSFFVPLVQAQVFYPFISPECLRTPHVSVGLPRAGYGAGDDGLRSLAPDTAQFVSSQGGEESSIVASCMPVTSDRISLEGHSLDAYEAVKLGRTLVWMGQRVHMRMLRRASGLPLPIDLVLDMDREKRGVDSLDKVLEALALVRAGKVCVTSVRALGADVATSNFEVHIEYPEGQGYPITVGREHATEFAAAVAQKGE